MQKRSRQAEELEELISGVTHKSYGTKDVEPTSHYVRFGSFPGATSSARVTGPCGETMEIYLQIDGDKIKDGSFFTNGCGASMACGTVAVMLAMGKSLDEAVEIEADTLMELIDNLPEDHLHCVTLAVATLQTAIHNHFAKPEHRHHLAAPLPEEPGE